MQKDIIIKNSKILMQVYKDGLLGQTNMPEDSHPDFSLLQLEDKLL
jgi:hypothetical protein